MPVRKGLAPRGWNAKRTCVTAVAFITNLGCGAVRGGLLKRENSTSLSQCPFFSRNQTARRWSRQRYIWGDRQPPTGERVRLEEFRSPQIFHPGIARVGELRHTATNHRVIFSIYHYRIVTYTSLFVPTIESKSDDRNLNAYIHTL